MIYVAYYRNLPKEYLLMDYEQKINYYKIISLFSLKVFSEFSGCYLVLETQETVILSKTSYFLYMFWVLLKFSIITCIAPFNYTCRCYRRPWHREQVLKLYNANKHSYSFWPLVWSKTMARLWRVATWKPPSGINIFYLLCCLCSAVVLRKGNLIYNVS